MRRGWGISPAFAALALVAVANGVLIQILMLSCLLYGMARRSLLPSGLAAISRRHVRVCATLVAGALVLCSVVALPFASLLRLSTWRNDYARENSGSPGWLDTRGGHSDGAAHVAGPARL